MKVDFNSKNWDTELVASLVDKAINKRTDRLDVDTLTAVIKDSFADISVSDVPMHHAGNDVFRRTWTFTINGRRAQMDTWFDGTNEVIGEIHFCLI